MSTLSCGRARSRRAARVVLASVGAAAAILAAGCGMPGPVVPADLHHLFPGLRVRYGGTARLRLAAPPPSAALPGANDLLAAPSPAAGSPASGGAVAGSTVLAATGRGIWRSTDGGVSWRPVLSGVMAWSLTAVMSGGYAAIGNLPARSSAGPLGRAVLATSTDGLHWRVLRVRAPGRFPSLGYGYRIALSGLGPTAIGIAVPDMASTFFTGTPLRSTDGGRTWRLIAVAGAPRSLRDGASTGLAMTDRGRMIFVTAPGPGARCAGAVYRSADAGATWSLLPASCQPYPLSAVQFISAGLGFAAGGLSYKAGGSQVVESTADGGRSWRTLWRTPAGNGGPGAGTGIDRLDMVSARDGWAIEGGCVGGENGPCGGAVFVTADGGSHWTSTGQGAIAIAGLGAGRAVSADDSTATQAITADGGRSWTVTTPPRWIATSGFSGTGRAQVWQNNLGYFLSRDAGSAWTGAGQLGTGRFEYKTWLAGAPGRLLGYWATGDLTSYASSDGGRTWTTSAVPDRRNGDVMLTAALGTGGSAIAVTGQGGQCQPISRAELRRIRKLKPGWSPPSSVPVLFTSSDGGARWSPAGRVLPFGVDSPAAAAVDGAHIAIIDACDRLQISADGGRHWHAERLRAPLSCAVSALGREFWLSCGWGRAQTWVLHSVNGGSTWTAFRLAEVAAANGMSSYGPGSPSVVFRPGGVFATRQGAAVMPAGGSVWRTTDGGASWAQSWPNAI